MRSRTAVMAVVVASISVLAGCASSPSSTPTHHGSTNGPSPAAVSPSPMLTPTAPAGTPLGAGERVWAAFSERGLPHDAWWARVRPLLSDAARAVYVYDDPRNIPSMTITGKIRVADKPPAEPRFTAEVVVPTSKGEFRLDLERHTLRSQWLLYAIRFPAGVQ